MTKNLSSDSPLLNESEDRFQRGDFAKRIAKTIIERQSKEGIVIGIYGAWGEGKTSVLNFIKNELEQSEQVLVITFNPWRYGDEDSLLKNFFHLIAESINKNISTKQERFGAMIEKYGGITKLFNIDIKEIGKDLSTVRIDELKTRVDALLKDFSQQLTIIIDDIDRLDRNELYALFRLVKLTADFHNTTYILAFDETMVSAAISERYGIGKESGAQFLEKIIQVPLKLPNAPIGSLRAYLFELLNSVLDESKIDIDIEESRRLITHLDQAIFVRLKSPRLAVRYANSLAFAIPLLIGETNIVDLILIEGIKIFYPAHYEFIRKNPKYFIYSYRSELYGNDDEKKKEEFTETFDQLNESLTRPEKKFIKDLLYELFPVLKEIFKNTVHHNGGRQWTKQQRVGSVDYFERYFSYSVIKGQISDVIFDEFISTLNSEDSKRAVKIFLKIIEKSEPSDFIRKLRINEEEYDWNMAKRLITFLTFLGQHFKPRNESIFRLSLDSDLEQASYLIFTLIKRHKDQEDLYEVLEAFVVNAPTLEFISEVIRLFYPLDNIEVNLNAESFKKVENVFLTRALTGAGKKPIFETNPFLIHHLFDIWKRHDFAGLKRYQHKILTKNPASVSLLLTAFAPIRRSSNHPAPYQTDITNKTYKYILEFCDEEILIKSINSSYGDVINEEEAIFYDKTDLYENQTELNILRQFIHWHKTPTVDDLSQIDT